jgi:hypothetical protein
MMPCGHAAFALTTNERFAMVPVRDRTRDRAGATGPGPATIPLFVVLTRWPLRRHHVVTTDASPLVVIVIITVVIIVVEIMLVDRNTSGRTTADSCADRRGVAA